MVNYFPATPGHLSPGAHGQLSLGVDNFDEYEDINFDYLENMIKGITNTVYIVLEYKARTISERHIGISSLLKRYGIIGDIVYDSPEKQPQLVTRNAIIQISSDYCQPALKYLFQHFQKTILALPRINAMDSRFPILWKNIEDICWMH